MPLSAAIRKPLTAVGAAATPPTLSVAAFYQFADLTGATGLDGRPADGLRQELRQLAGACGVRGTILLASEGVNGTLCGSDAGVEAVLERLRAIPGLGGMRARHSRTPSQAFDRLRVRWRPEIVTMGRPDLRPGLDAPTGIPAAPARWDALIADPHTLVIDTRNAFEVAMGSFPGALDPGLPRFGAFPAWVHTQLKPELEQRRAQRIALFCTGGIRCEKASALLLREGLPEVHQLEGGILRYLAEIPPARSRWRGACFVFDRRGAVGHGLAPLFPADGAAPA